MNPVTSDPIVEEITINGSADRIFEALINPAERVNVRSVRRQKSMHVLENSISVRDETSEHRSASPRPSTMAEFLATLVYDRPTRKS